MTWQRGAHEGARRNRRFGRIFAVPFFLLLGWCASGSAEGAARGTVESGTREFAVQGLVKEIKNGEHQVVIAHREIGGYMGAMTMPFNVEDPAEMASLQPGDAVSFLLEVTETRSWIRQIRKQALAPRKEEAGLERSETATVAVNRQAAPSRPSSPVLDFPFTNELGKPVRLSDFRGQALAVTFFFTRCPLPEYCPRLSKNFAAASRKLAALPNAPTNWHFLSVSFDSAFDTPSVLKQYAESYNYDPGRWSFITGPAEEIAELARGSDFTFVADHGSFNHNFRTLIIDAAGHLQMMFPTSGDLTEELVSEMLKAAAVPVSP